LPIIIPLAEVLQSVVETVVGNFLSEEELNHHYLPPSNPNNNSSSGNSGNSGKSGSNSSNSSSRGNQSSSSSKSRRRGCSDLQEQDQDKDKDKSRDNAQQAAASSITSTATDWSANSHSYSSATVRSTSRSSSTSPPPPLHLTTSRSAEAVLLQPSLQQTFTVRRSTGGRDDLLLPLGAQGSYSYHNSTSRSGMSTSQPIYAAAASTVTAAVGGRGRSIAAIPRPASLVVASEAHIAWALAGAAGSTQHLPIQNNNDSRNSSSSSSTAALLPAYVSSTASSSRSAQRTATTATSTRAHIPLLMPSLSLSPSRSSSATLYSADITEGHGRSPDRLQSRRPLSVRRFK
jgi:hypothetical protein